MVTIHRHPVPTDSYDPERPLNDLLLAELDHFKHIAQKLPSDLRKALPAAPSPDDREAVDLFIAAITRALVSQKRERLHLVQPGIKPTRRQQPDTLDIAAAAEQNPAPSKPAKAKSKKQPKTTARFEPGNETGPKQ